MKVLCTGGAGYVGSHCTAALLRAGHDVTVLDNLSMGHRAAVGDVPIIEADVTDRAGLFKAVAGHGFEAAVHFAALWSVGESVHQPDRYYHVNVIGSLNLMDALVAAGCRRLIFSSSAAVYGQPRYLPIPESHPANPVNPYGETKRTVEGALRWYASKGLLGSVALRYFNAAGAAESGLIGEDHHPEEHLIPLVLQAALGQRDEIAVFGTDYDTPDGTCVRDYIHVADLADAHVLAIRAVEPDQAKAYNVGTGRGHSVREVVETARAVTGHPIPARETDRRAGDPPELVAAADAIQRDLGWHPVRSELAHIISTAWAWHAAHPHGFDD